MKIEYSKELISYDEMNQLTELVGWGKNYYKSLSVWHMVLKNSSCIAYIKKDNKVIGFGRIVEDGLMCMFYDICVHPDYQRNGIGTKIMQSLLKFIEGKDFVTTGLFVWKGNPNAKSFYQSLGFKETIAMEF